MLNPEPQSFWQEILEEENVFDISRPSSSELSFMDAIDYEGVLLQVMEEEGRDFSLELDDVSSFSDSSSPRSWGDSGSEGGISPDIFSRTVSARSRLNPAIPPNSPLVCFGQERIILGPLPDESQNTALLQHQRLQRSLHFL